jgi:hypothetical protein
VYIETRHMRKGCIVTYKELAWLIIMGSGFDDWVYWHLSHIELLLGNVCLTNLGLISTIWIQSQSQSHIATDGQSATKSWYLAPDITIWQLRSCFCGEPSLTRGRVCLLYAAGPCQRSLSRVRVLWDSRPYFTVSDLRLHFSSPPTTRRVTVEVFDPASTRVYNLNSRMHCPL